MSSSHPPALHYQRPIPNGHSNWIYQALTRLFLLLMGIFFYAMAIVGMLLIVIAVYSKVSGYVSRAGESLLSVIALGLMFLISFFLIGTSLFQLALKPSGKAEATDENMEG